MTLDGERRGAQVSCSRPDVCDPSERVFERAVGAVDHSGVESDAGHHGEALAVHGADVDPPAYAGEPDFDGRADLLGDAEVGRQQVRGAGGNDRKGGVGAGERVDAALCQPVSAPGEDHFRTAGKGAAHLFRRLLAL